MLHTSLDPADASQDACSFAAAADPADTLLINSTEFQKPNASSSTSSFRAYTASEHL